jgi:hypothetical protein
MNKISLKIWLKKRFNRRFRLTSAFVAIFLIGGALLFYLPSVVPRYLFTLGERFSVLTPKSFNLGQLYDFNTLSEEDDTMKTQVSETSKELALPRPDNHMIVFKYPEVVSLGRPTYLGSEISQSVDFTVKKPPAIGLIQIWVLNTSLEDFLEASKSNSTIEYIHFNSKQEKKDALSYILWDYTFTKDNATIHGLEAFFDDKPYMYRISVYVESKNYDESFQSLFDGMVRSVTVR